jgi:hypothetical protein
MFLRAATAAQERSAESPICKKFIIKKNPTSMNDPALHDNYSDQLF